MRVLKDGKNPVDDERHDRGARADPAEQRNRNQESEEGEARNRLHDVGRAEDRARQPRPAGQRHPDGHADRDGDRRRSGDEEEVLAGEGRDLAAALPEEPRELVHVENSETNSRTKSSAGRCVRSSRVPAWTHAAAVEDGDPVGEAERLGEVVRDEQDGGRQRPLPRQELALDGAARDRIERAEGLVHEHQRRVRGERPGHADALALAARELARQARRRTPPCGRPTVARSSSARARRFASGQPSRRGTVSTFSRTVQWGKRPPSWMT